MTFAAGFIPAVEAADSRWESFVRDRFVTAELATAGPAEGTVRCAAELKASYDDVKAVVLDFERMPDWLPGLREFRVLEHGDHDAIIYVRHALPWPFKDRDYAMRYTWQEGAGRITITSALVNEKAPKATDVVRLEGTRTSWVIETRGDATRVEYMFHRPYGDVPLRLQKEAWRFEVHTVMKNLRDEVKRRTR